MGQFSSSNRLIPPDAIVGPMPKITNQPATGWKYHYRILLEHGREYHFDNFQVGTFPITGGSCGSFTVQGGHSYTLIYDGNRNLVFCDGGRWGDLVTIQDNPGVNSGSSVVLTSTWRGSSFVDLPIEIQGGPNKRIILRGIGHFTITGSGSELEHRGCGKVTVNGDLQSLKHTGRGDVEVHGSVIGTVVASYLPKPGDSSTAATITIDGDVGGNVVLNDGGATVHVKGTHHGILELPSKFHVDNGRQGAVVKIGGKRYVEKEEDEEAPPAKKQKKEKPGISGVPAISQDGLDEEEDEDSLYD